MFKFTMKVGPFFLKFWGVPRVDQCSKYYIFQAKSTSILKVSFSKLMFRLLPIYHVFFLHFLLTSWHFSRCLKTEHDFVDCATLFCPFYECTYWGKNTNSSIGKAQNEGIWSLSHFHPHTYLLRQNFQLMGQEQLPFNLLLCFPLVAFCYACLCSFVALSLKIQLAAVNLVSLINTRSTSTDQIPAPANVLGQIKHTQLLLWSIACIASTDFSRPRLTCRGNPVSN